MERAAVRTGCCNVPAFQQIAAEVPAGRCVCGSSFPKGFLGLSWNGRSMLPVSKRMEHVKTRAHFGVAASEDDLHFPHERNRTAGLPCRGPNVPRALARAEPVSTPEVEAFLDLIKWDSKGLAVAIAQHVDTGAILMQGFVNRDAVSATLASCRATFFSRSRSQLWTKGETSSNFIEVEDVFLDCDSDSIIYLGKPDGPTCHTGAETCYFTSASQKGLLAKRTAPSTQALTTLYSLEATIAARKVELSSDTGKPSWTKKLLTNQSLLCSKIREEADELCRTVEQNEGKQRTTSEMADVLYHTLVLLSVQDVKMEEVLDLLRARFAQSGVEEKNSRKQKTEAPQA